MTGVLSFVPFALHVASATVFAGLAAHLFTYRNSPLARASLTLLVPFAWWSLSLALAHLPGVTQDVAQLAYHLSAVGWAPIGSAAVLFAITLLRPASARRPALWLALAIPPGLVLLAHWRGALAGLPAARPWGWAYTWRDTDATRLFHLYYGVFTAAALVAVGVEWLRAPALLRRRQARMIAGPGLAAFALGSLVDAVLPRLGVEAVPNLACDLMLVWAVGLVVAINRYRILELTPTVAIDRIVETMSDALFLTTPAGQITWANPAARALVGPVGDELRGRTLLEVLALSGDGWDDLLATGRAEHVVRHRDGAERRVEVSAAPLRDPAGQPAGVVCVARDITALHAEIEARVRADRRYRQLVETMQEGVWLVDRDDRVTLVNPRMATLLGVTVDAQLGRPVLELVDPACADACRAALATARGGTASQAEWLLGGSAPDVPHAPRVPALVHVVPLPAADGDGYDGAIVTATDLSDRKKIETALAQADRLSTVGRLAAGVGHDINNPLTYVLANLEEITTLAGDDGDPAAARAAIRDAARDAQDGVHRVRDIVADLRRFAIDAPADAGPIDVHEPIEDALKFAMNELRFRTQLVRAYGPDVPMVAGARVKLSQVLLNLLVNAAHAIPAGDTARNEVRIQTWREPGHACVAVEDTGAGIRPADLPHIFEPFFSTKLRTGGTGLGLAISREIIVGLGGTIEVTSTVGQGTRFVIRLPASTTARAAERRHPRTPTDKLRGLRVLVVDDEPLILAALARSLARRVAVVTATSVAEARAHIEATPIDLVFCDVMMPDELGLELVTWLAARQHPLADRVVFLTGGVFTPEVERGLATVKRRVLEKPVAATALYRTIDELVAPRS